MVGFRDDDDDEVRVLGIEESVVSVDDSVENDSVVVMGSEDVSVGSGVESVVRGRGDDDSVGWMVGVNSEEVDGGREEMGSEDWAMTVDERDKRQRQRRRMVMRRGVLLGDAIGWLVGCYWLLVDRYDNR